MALTYAITDKPAQSLGAVKATFGVATFDSSYPAPGGEDFDIRAQGLNQLLFLLVTNGAGRPVRWDGSTSAPKLVVYQDATPAAAAALPEVTNATNLATLTVTYVAIGY